MGRRLNKGGVWNILKTKKIDGIKIKEDTFYSLKNKKIIEFFGQRFHEKSEEKNRILYFKSYGYDTLIIWEKDFRKNKKEIYEGIKEFGGEVWIIKL